MVNTDRFGAHRPEGAIEQIEHHQGHQAEQGLGDMPSDGQTGEPHDHGEEGHGEELQPRLDVTDCHVSLIPSIKGPRASRGRGDRWGNRWKKRG